MGVGDALARWVYNNQPVKFAAIELVPTTSSDVPETLLGRLNDDGTVSGGIPIPGLASWLSDPEYRPPDVVQGWTRCPRTNDRPCVRSTSSISPGTSWWAWEHCCSCCPCGTAPAGRSGAGCRRAGGSFAAAASGVLAVICMEAGWIVTEVGRQPWIVYGLMKVEDAATANTGVWISVHRGRRAVRAGHHDPRPARNEQAVPQSRRLHRPRRALRTERRRPRNIPDAEEATGEHRGRRGAACGGGRVRRVRRRRFRSRVLGPDRGRPERGARPRAVIEHPIGPVEANHVWLIFIFVILWTSFSQAYASITLTLFVPLMIAALGIVLPRGASFAFRKAVVTTRTVASSEPGSPFPRCWFPTAWERS